MRSFLGPLIGAHGAPAAGWARDHSTNPQTPKPMHVQGSNLAVGICSCSSWGLLKRNPQIGASSWGSLWHHATGTQGPLFLRRGSAFLAFLKSFQGRSDHPHTCGPRAPASELSGEVSVPSPVRDLWGVPVSIRGGCRDAAPVSQVSGPRPVLASPTGHGLLSS